MVVICAMVLDAADEGLELQDYALSSITVGHYVVQVSKIVVFFSFRNYYNISVYDFPNFHKTL